MDTGAQDVQNPQVQQTRPPVILHFGRDRHLLAIRSKILQLSGHPVEDGLEIRDMDALLDRYSRGLVVLCHSLGAAEQAEVLSRVRQRRPAFKSLLLAKHMGTPSSPHDGDTISTMEGPHALLSKARQLLSSGGLPRK